MPIRLHEAHALDVGARLTFGGDQVFTVLAVEPSPGGVRLLLERDDGYETFATQHDLDVATVLPADERAEEADADGEDEVAATEPDKPTRTPKRKPAPKRKS